MTKYASISRHLWRVQWLMEFLGVIMGKLNENREEKFKNLARDAYAEVLEKHHGFIYRKIARAAVIAVASRENFLTSLR